MKVKIKGLPKGNNGLKVEDNNIKQLSPNIAMITGDSHSQGGEMVSYGGQTIEAQGNEPVAINNQGDAVFFGKLKIPDSKMTFEKAAKNIAEEEVKNVKTADKAVALVSVADPYDKFESLKFNTGVVLGNAAQIKQNQLNQERESLGNLQQAILDTADYLGIDPKKVVKMKNGGTIKAKVKGLPQYQFGGSVLPRNWTLAGEPMPLPSYQQAPMGTYIQPAPIGNDEESLRAQIRSAAQRNGISPELYEKQLFQESSLNPSARSKAGAVGIAQIIPGTAKELGLTSKELRSTKPEDVAKQIDAGARYMAQLKDQFNGDETLALAAYNGGAKNIKGNLQTLAKRTGRNVEDLTGADWYNFMDTRKDLPSGQKETVNYFNNLVNLPTEDFYSNKGSAVSNFQRDFYIPRPELSTPPIRTDNDFVTPTGMTQTQYQPDMSRAIPGFNDQLTNNTQASLLQDQIAARPQIPFNQEQPQDQFRPARNNFNYMSILPEIAAVLDRPDYVQGQQFTPTLYEPYRVSFADQINQNQANFNQVAQLANNNPAALATLAGQLYGQNQQVLGNEFRTNQQISNQVSNQNTELLNQAQLQNLQLADQQYQRQEAARALTEQNRMNALTSISDKVQQNQIFNRNRQLAENMFNFRPDENYQLQYIGPDAQFNFNQPIQGQQLTPEQQKALIEQQRLDNQTRRVNLQEQQQLRRSQNNWFGQLLRGRR